jgi:glycine/D-amino acid oxidase-like deaminating enzyme
VGGMIRFNCGAFWPYRFITTWWEILHKQYSSRLNIETNTPVKGISYDESSSTYILTTPRGLVRTKKLFHATNGYTGHLLPKLRGAIMPIRGFMSAQKAPPIFGNYGRDRSWSFFGAKGPLDEKTGIQESGVYYGNQSPNEDTIFWGNDLIPVDQWIAADDSMIPPATKEDLSTVLPKQFTAWDGEGQPEVKEMWSGTLGYTADHLPLVGSLPSSITARNGDGEFICAGFNGAGMCQCWSSGEAAVKVALGESAEGIVPDLFLTTKERLEGKDMNGKVAVHAMFSGDWKH